MTVLTEIRPPRRLPLPSMRALWAYRDLLRRFIARDITLRYRQTALGALWVVGQPLLGAGAFTLAFSRIAGLKVAGVSYLLFSLCGLLVWNFFSGVASRCVSSLTGNAALVSKVYFPRLILPLSTLGSAMVDFLVGLALAAVIAGVQSPRLLDPTWLVVAPALVVVACLALGVGAAAGALAVRFRDVGYVIPVALQFFLFVSPVAYPLRQVPHELRSLYELNPLTGVLEWVRWSLLDQPQPPALATVVSLTAALGALVIGMLIFTSEERRFADVI